MVKSFAQNIIYLYKITSFFKGKLQFIEECIPLILISLLYIKCLAGASDLQLIAGRVARGL